MWKMVRADIFCESVRDGTHDTPKPTDFGYKLVTGKHIKNGIIDPTEAYFISEKDYNSINARSAVEQWDVLMSMIGTVGEAAVVKSKPDYAIKNVALFKCGHSELKGKWLYYYLRSPQAKGHMEGNQKGSSQQFLSLGQLRSLPVPIADDTYTQKVVDILSAYDNLIENNRRQIKLLEDAARRLYREWFVELRFPGHEGVKVVDGVPEGWKWSRFSDVADIMSGGTPKTENKSYYGGNIPFYTPKDSDGAYYAMKTITYITEDGLNNCHSPLYPAGTIIITARGTVGKTTILETPMAMNQSCYALKCSNHKKPFYLFFALNEEVRKLKAMANGGVFNTIIVKTFDNIGLFEPGGNLIDCFNNLVEPYMEMIKAKMHQIDRLTMARDMLLPKLMSGSGLY